MVEEVGKNQRKSEALLSIKKHVHNSVMVVAVALPNLAITLSTVTVLAVVFHWSGWLATLAYLIGQFFSVQWSALFNRGAKTSFTLGHWTYHFAEKPPDSPPTS